MGEARKRYSTLCAISHADKGKSVGWSSQQQSNAEKNRFRSPFFHPFSWNTFFPDFLRHENISLAGAGVEVGERRKRKKLFYDFSNPRRENAEEIQFQANKILIRI